ncbi:MAG: ComEC/Rec2 family competence protein, partial [Gallicola sp.]|nr:ComEC/Rec2 family competence protein [Gallicola sp.]
MKKLLISLQYEWLIIGACSLSSLLFWQKPTLYLFLLCLLATVRLLSSQNRSLIVVTLVISGLLIGRYSVWQTEERAIAELSLAGQEVSAYISYNPNQFDWTANYIRGEGQLRFRDGEEEKVLQVSVIKWLEDDDSMFQKAMEKSSLLLVKGEFSHIAEARNFAVFDFREYQAQKGIHWEFTIHEFLEGRALTGINARLQDLRFQFLKQFTDGEANSWVAMHNKLLWNIGSESFQDSRAMLSQMGILHFFAISGFHLFAIRKLLTYLSLRLGMTNRIAGLVSNFLLFAYLFLIDFPVGVLRAYTMYLFALLVRILDLPISRIDQFVIIAISFLFMQPANLTYLSFILSFLMTLILLLFEVGEHSLKGWQLNMLQTFLCLLFSWPILMNVSFEWNILQIAYVTIISPIFNLIIMPLAFMTSLILLLPFSLFDFVLAPLGFLW